MKKKITIATLVLGLSVASGSVYAAGSNNMMEPTKSTPTSTVGITDNIESSEIIDFNEMAKEKGITLDELFAQLEAEGMMTKAVESTLATEITEGEKFHDTINLEEMAKEKGITLDELISQLEKEGKLTKAAKLTDSMQVEASNQ